MTPAAQEPRPVPRTIWPAFVAYGIFWAANGVVGMITAVVFFAKRFVSGAALPVPAEKLGDTTGLFGAMMESFAQPWVILVSIVGSVLIHTIIALKAAKLTRLPSGQVLRLNRANLRALYLVPALLAILCIGGVFEQVVALADLERISLLPVMGRAVGRAGGLTLVGLVIFFTLAGVAEELFYRGYIQTRLRRRLRPWTAILITAALFGIAHTDPLHTPFAFAAGLYFGWITERSGSIAPAMAVHCVNNLLAVVLPRVLPSGWEARVPWTLLAVYAVVGAASVVLLGRLHRPRAVGP
jgi:membrane protease YdiL (CAAX protease family)